jgi:murein DD-endopeptidase MepM/ murein hydrolase activator NlpD
MELKHADYKTKTNLTLPFNGVWIIGNGGRDPKINNHLREDGASPINQTFAYDFIKEHKGGGTKLEDYEAFTQKVIAPGEGIISQVINGSFDNEIGETDLYVIVGNTVVIDHHNGEWSVLAHFKHNSIQVTPGEEVKQGDVLGLCGNTGNTSEPHIHYHLQNHKLISKGEGLPIQFSRIVVDDEIKQVIEVKRSQKVQNV